MVSNASSRWEMTKAYDLEIGKQQIIISKAKGQDWFRILQEIKRIIPKNASLSSLNSDENGSIIFIGEAVDQNSVFDFVLSLKRSRFFIAVKLEESKSKSIQDEARIYFVIKCLLENKSKESR